MRFRLIQFGVMTQTLTGLQANRWEKYHMAPTDVTSQFTAENAEELLEMLLDHLYGNNWGFNAVLLQVHADDCWVVLRYLYPYEDPAIIKSLVAEYWRDAQSSCN